MDVEIAVRFKLSNLISEEALKDIYEGSLWDCVKDMINEEGLGGLVDEVNGDLIWVNRL